MTTYFFVFNHSMFGPLMWPEALQSEHKQISCCICFYFIQCGIVTATKISRAPPRISSDPVAETPASCMEKKTKNRREVLCVCSDETGEKKQGVLKAKGKMREQ